MEEWLAICHAFWDAHGPVSHSGRFYRISEGRLNTPFVGCSRTRPEIYIGGNSVQARDLAARYGDCWMRFANAPDRVAEQAAPVLQRGAEVGLRLSIACRRSRAEALQAARAPLSLRAAETRSSFESRFVNRSDAVSMKETYDLGETEWLTPWLWTGAVRTLGAPWVYILGTPDEVAAGLLEFRAAGVTQFILSGLPAGEEIIRFGEEVLPLIRREEGGGAAAVVDSPAHTDIRP
jgi:alkanesulfonate monooxygenase